MGGNALKQYHTTRLDRDAYFALTEEFSALFQEKIGAKLYLIPAYKTKPSFGDADFLVTTDELPADWVSKVATEFGLTKEQWVKNGNCLSIGYKNFQIDLIATKPEHLFASLTYFSYNDLGNLIGRMGHKLGLKFGHRGISIVVRGNDRTDHILKEITLTHDLKHAFEILGLDFQKFLEGFDDLEDIFQYVASSKYFDPEIYALEHRSATSRIRDKKRATYSAFLKWVDETKPVVRHSFAEKSELGGYSIREPYYTNEVLSRWPHVKAEVEALIAAHTLNTKFKNVFNGTLVTLCTGLVKQELGAFMSKFSSTVTEQDKLEWIDSPTAVVVAVSDYYDIYKKELNDTV